MLAKNIGELHNLRLQPFKNVVFYVECIDFRDEIHFKINEIDEMHKFSF